LHWILCPVKSILNLIFLRPFAVFHFKVDIRNRTISLTAFCFCIFQLSKSLWKEPPFSFISMLYSVRCRHTFVKKFNSVLLVRWNLWLHCRRPTRRLLLLFQTQYSIPGLRFRPPRSVFAKSEENPENACYCHPDKEFCPPSGLLKISPCVYGKADFVKREPHRLIKPSFHLKSYYIQTLGYVGLYELRITYMSETHNYWWN